MIIGVTGGVGCGKSAVMDILKREYGARVLIADEIGHEVMKKGTAAFDEILSRFGKNLLGVNGELNRPALAQLIYSDDEKREELNGIIHPYVKSEIANRLKEWDKEPLVVLETALLFETGCDTFCDCVWGIHTEKEVRIERLRRTRGYTREKAETIMAKQLSEREFQQRCDAMIDNSGTPEELRMRLSQLILGIKEKM